MSGVYVFYLWVILLCRLLVTLFRLISFQSVRFVTFSAGTTFLLSPVSSVAVLKLSRSSINTSEWFQYIHSRAPLLTWIKMCLFVYSEFFLCKLTFACAILDAISVLLRPSLDIKGAKYLNWSLCLSLSLSIKMLISLFRLSTITFVCLLFSSNPFFLLSFSTIFIIKGNFGCKSTQCVVMKFIKLQTAKECIWKFIMHFL